MELLYAEERQRGNTPVIVPSGGKGTDELRAEAEAMGGVPLGLLVV